MLERRKDRMVYKVINKINGKVYIGFCVSFNERKARHIKNAEKGVKTKFYNAIRKYGKDSFQWDILYDDLKTIENCKKIEIQMIKEYNSYLFGYNSTLGGDGGFTGPNSGQFKKGMNPWSTGIKLSEEHVEKLRVSHRGLKQSDKQINKRVSKFFKPVIQMDLNGLYIKEFPSIKEAGIITGCSKTNISSVCLKRKGYKTAGGYKWEFKNN